MNKVIPLRDKVLIERKEAETKTTGGIIIPDTAKEKPAEGVILAVGEGTRDTNGKLIPLEVNEGQKVLFEKWGATEVKINNKELLIIEVSKILAIIE